MIKIKRVYDPPSKDDGVRILVDRLWPRGVSKESAHIDSWIKEAGPSTVLRKWFNHDPEKWTEFKKRFFAELSGKQVVVDELVGSARKGTITLLFGSKEQTYNNATALKEYIDTALHARERKKAA